MWFHFIMNTLKFSQPQLQNYAILYNNKSASAETLLLNLRSVVFLSKHIISLLLSRLFGNKVAIS